MLHENIKAAARVDTAALAKFIALGGLASFLPFFIHLQWVTGPIVNAILILTLFIVGSRAAYVLCLVPSLLALAGGLLPSVLAPVLPFIMLGNVLLVMSVDKTYAFLTDANKGFWYGVGLGALLKFGFLRLGLALILPSFLDQPVLAKAAVMLSWPQLATAATGGLIAWGFLKWLKRI